MSIFAPLGNTNVTRGHGIQNDVLTSNVTVNCDPRLVVPKLTLAGRKNALYKEEIAGKIAVEHDLCDLDVRNLTVHGTLIVPGNTILSCTLIEEDGTVCCPLTVTNTEASNPQTSRALCVNGSTQMRPASGVTLSNANAILQIAANTLTTGNGSVFDIEAHNMQNGLVSEIIMGSLTSGIGFLVRGRPNPPGATTGTTLDNNGRYTSVDADAESGNSPYVDAKTLSTQNITISEITARDISDNVSRRPPGPYNTEWWDGQGLSVKQSAHTVKSLGQNLPATELKTNASNVTITLPFEVRYPTAFTWVLNGVNVGTAFTFQLKNSSGVLLPLLVDVKITPAGLTTTDLFSAWCIRQSPLEAGSLLGINVDEAFIFPDDIGYVAGQFVEPPSGTPANNIEFQGNGPIIFPLRTGVMNSIGTNTIEGGLTISADNAATALPVNHIHSIGPSGTPFLVGTDEPPPAGTGCALSTLVGSTDVAGTIKLELTIGAGSTSCFAKIFDPAALGGPVDLIEYKFHTPYMQRASGKVGAPVVIITPDARLAPFGFTLAPIVELNNTGGGPAGSDAGTSSTIIAWDQKLVPNTTMTSLCDGFVIVPTILPAAGTIGPGTLIGYIRYHVICPLSA